MNAAIVDVVHALRYDCNLRHHNWQGKINIVPQIWVNF